MLQLPRLTIFQLLLTSLLNYDEIYENNLYREDEQMIV